MSLKFQKNFLYMNFWPYMKIMSHGEKILHNGLMVNKSPNPKKKKKNSIIQILDDYDID